MILSMLLLMFPGCLAYSLGWGGGLKPLGFATILSDQCVGEEGWRYRGSGGGQVAARVVGEVAGPVTSRAVLALLHGATGHQPIMACSQGAMNAMEERIKATTRKVQYQVRCKATKKPERCLWFDAFMERMEELLGRCFTKETVAFIMRRQRRYLRRVGGCRRVHSSTHHREVVAREEEPLRIIYSNYLRSILNRL